MTVGKYLKNLLKQKSISVSELTARLGLSSRNTLYRLFSGEISREKRISLIGAIMEVVQFTEDETETLNRLMTDGVRFNEEVNDILMNVYSSEKGGYRIKGKTLYERLRCRRGLETIVMFGVREAAAITDISKFLAENTSVTVYHYLKFPKVNTLAVYEVLALIKLSEFPNYVPLEIDRAIQDGIYVISRDNGKCRLQLIELTENEPILLETQISGATYKYMTDKNERIKSKCTPIKRKIDRVQSYMNTLEDTLEIEEGDSFYCEGAPCFGYLPMEFLYEMFAGIDFFGYPEEHPYVRRLITHMTEKNKKLYSIGKKRFLYDEKHLRAMMETGFAIDHVSEFPPLTMEQRRRYFKWLIDYLKRDDKNISCRMLKGIEIKHSYVYEDGHMLYMYRPNTELNNMDVSVIMLRNKSVDEAMRYFTEYLWDRFTLSEEETVAILEGLVREYLG